MSELSIREINPTRDVSRRTVFPLVRHLSSRVTPILAKLPVTANQITVMSLACGLFCSWLMTKQTQPEVILGAILLVFCYVLDNCDGEIARLKGQSSNFGSAFDTCVDWLVHTTFLVALGWGVSQQNGSEIWLWLGLTAAAGATVNYVLTLYMKSRDGARRPLGHDEGEEVNLRPQGWWEWLIFPFRELARADFRIVVLFLACIDGLSILLPLAALGAQVYWLTLFVEKTRKYHV